MRYILMANRLMVLFIVVLLSTSTVWGLDAAAKEEAWEKFGISAGYFISNVDSTVRLGTAVGVEIDVEDLFGLDSTMSVFRVGALWRFSENRRHRLDVSWFSLSRDSSKRILEDITFENDEGEMVTIEAGTGVEANFDIDIVQLFYRYSFLQDDRIDLSAGIGLYIMPIDLGFSAGGGLSNEQASADFIAPLPVVGVSMDVLLAPQWYFRSGAQVFYVEYENFTGSLLTVDAAVEYKPWQHIGIGVGFDALDIRVKAEGEDWPEVDLNGKVRFNYTGLQLYLRYFY